MDKAAIFIDQGYFGRVLELLNLQKTHFLPNNEVKFENKLDYLKFSEKLCRIHNSERFRTYVYDQRDPPQNYDSNHFAEKQKFKVYLDSLPSFLTRYGACMLVPNKKCQMHMQGKLSRPCEHITQKGVDVRFSIDLVSLATDKRIDKAILITGDSDFIPAISYAREVNMKVFLYYYEGGSTFAHKGLRFGCDDRFLFTPSIFEDVLLSRSS